MFGYPMKYLNFAFTDVVSGKPVNYYSGSNGKIYMANYRWSLFRVETASYI